MGQLIVNLTHDVDRISKTYQYITKNLAKFKLKFLFQIFYQTNPYWCFDKIIELEDKYKVRSTFFFLEESLPINIFKPSKWFLTLGRYNFDNKKIQQIIKKLDSNGWEIGLHGSYNSYKELSLLTKEKDKLEKILGKEVIGIRQHHLNLNIPDTWKLQSKAGFLYDASYGKKRGLGFLDKKNKPFNNSESNMCIIPLTFMEFNLMNEAENNIEIAWSKLLEIINLAEKTNSVLSVLWHQRMFNEKEFPGYYCLYEKLIVECQKRNSRFLTCKEVYQNFSNNN